jgi:hypothetical protein
VTVQQLLAWMQVAQAAIPAGIATIETIKGWISVAHQGQMSDAQLNAAIGLVFDDATRRKALAIADALGQPAPATS